MNPPTIPGTVLMGGGTDVEDAFLWMIKNANGGDFLILRASGDEAYNPWVFNLSIANGGALNTVTTVLFNSKAASYETYIIDKIKNSEVIWFAGGDQSYYMNWWAGTPVQSAIQDKLKFITIGGTSAGLAILGNWVFSCQHNTIYSAESLRNPYDFRITIADRFLGIAHMGDFITDTHFVTRNRMGRMLTFIARLATNSTGAASALPGLPYGIGVNESTAFLINQDTGVGTLVGTGTAYVCNARELPSVCSSGQPLSYAGIDCVRLSASVGDAYDFKNKVAAKGGVSYSIDITEGRLDESAQYGPK